MPGLNLKQTQSRIKCAFYLVCPFDGWLTSRSPSCDDKPHKVRGLQIKPRKEDQTQEPVFTSGGCVTGQTQAVEILTDDNESVSSSLSEPPPTYEQAPQGVHINQDGFQARATAACESKSLVSSTRLLSHAYF